MGQETGGNGEMESDRGKTTSPFGYPRNGRKLLCGVWTLHGARAVKLSRNSTSRRLRPRAVREPVRFTRLRCKCWSCSLCGPRKAKQYRTRILRAVGRAKLTRMITLTLDAREIATASEAATFFEHFEAQRAIRSACRCETCSQLQARSIAHIRECWNKLRVYLHRRYGVAPKYIAVLEFQKTTGLAHLHIVIDRYIEQAWAKEVWSAVGGGQHVDIRHVDAHRAGAYLSKYLSKELLLSAPPGMRRVTTSRSIKLNEKRASEYVWEICRSPIDRVYVLFGDTATNEVLSDGELDSFSARE